MCVSLREHFEALLEQQETKSQERVKNLEHKIAALEALIDAKQEALALATQVQASTMESRLAGVNEWRQTFGDVANRAVSQDVFNVKQDEVGRRLNSIEQLLAGQTGRIVGFSSGVSFLALIIGIIIQLIVFGG